MLDGLQLAAEAVGSRRAYLYVHSGGRLHERLRHALAERSAAGLDRVAVSLVCGPPRFLAGEESALVNRIEGGLALPTFRPPRTFERGVGGAPTLVQNVETLAHVALIARHGAAWFREVGTPDEPGSMLTTCHLADGTTEVAEVAIGTPLAALLRLGAPPVQAVLTGGYHGTWIPPRTPPGCRSRTPRCARQAPRSARACSPRCQQTGAASRRPRTSCATSPRSRRVSAAPAWPACRASPTRSRNCRAANPDPRWLTHLERWAGLVVGRGACHHPDGTVRFVRSALTVFSGEIAAHRRGRCAADAAAPAAPTARTARTRAPFLPVPAGAPVCAQDWR